MKYHFWELKNKDCWRILVYADKELSEDAIVERARFNNLVPAFGKIDVRYVDRNELCMKDKSTFAYSLFPRATRIGHLLK